MGQITKDHLDFLHEAKVEFELNPFRETIRNEDDTLIALRMGEDRDCVMIFRLDGYVANFVQQINPVPLEIVEDDELRRIKR